MSRGKRSRIVVIAALSAGLAAPGASEATDLGTVDGISYVLTPSSGTPPASATGDAVCPNATRPLGGGFWAGNVSFTSRVYNSYPADVMAPLGPQMQETYRSTFWLPSGPTTQVESYGICSGAEVQYRLDRGDLPATPQALKLTANCPASQHVVGGGATAGQSGSIADAYVNSSYPIDDGDRNRTPDDGWRARLYGASQLDAAAIAVCAETKPRYRRLVSASNEITVIDCPANRHVLGAGLKVHGDPSTAWMRSATLIDDVSDEPDTVPDDVVGFDETAESGRRVTAHAICG